MHFDKMAVWLRGAAVALMATLAMVLSACGGGGAEAPPVVEAPPAGLEVGDESAFQKILAAQPAAPAASTPGGPGGDMPPTLTVHYRRADGAYAGWQLHSWGAGRDPGWGAGYNASGSDAFGAVYEVALNADAKTGAEVGYLFHKGDDKDHGGADQKLALKAGRNEIWRIAGDGATYTGNPLGAAPPDITTVRVHYKRYGGDYGGWGLHLWDGSGLDVGRLPPAMPAIANWSQPVPLDKLPNYAASAAEAVFELPVLNPRQDASRKALEFIVHGLAPNENDKDGRDANIRVDLGALTVRNGVGEIWLVQQDATVHLAAPDTRQVSASDARAVWLGKRWLQWPRVDGGGQFKLYHSATAQITAVRDGKVVGHDGALTLERFAGSLPAATAQRFRYVAPGVVLSVKDADLGQLPELLKKQLLLVQEDADGKVQNATTAQLAGALDELYAAAAQLDDLGVRIANGATRFKLWAPTAQKVSVFTYDSGTGPAKTIDHLTFDAATGAWSASRGGDLSGKYYRYAVEVVVRGVGLVRNHVTDPYSIGLTTDSKRSYIANLDAAALKPAGWDALPASTKVAAATDMSIYELHVRDFSINDPTVSAAARGKYAAFAEAGSNGMKHLKALAEAGLTDVHLLPVFDIASVPEAGCTTPTIDATAAADSEVQQASVAATAGTDCFNWGYDPYHFNAPEGSYASDAADGGARIREFRQMVMGLKQAGLRVGMDVVYNHTTASGQNERAVLDRIVPGYYHRLNAAGGVERSTCCDNTATENLMMAKLMSDSVLLWARDYKIDSFRFDLMAHQPRAAMEEIKGRLKTALGRDVQLLGEGWNFGEVANGARFVQASQLSLNGSGIATFSDRARDHVRGGSGFDGAQDIVRNQGFINGLFYDANASGANKSRNDLMWSADIVKVGLAGSLRDFELTTHWDATLKLGAIDYGGQPAGYVTQPGEVVNYVENHDNQTLFDINAYKLPLTTSREDRARVQMLGAAINAFSQGIAYFHAGVDTLRSKSLDRNSYDAGDWFNRIDWSYQQNYFGTGAPMKGENQGDGGANYGVIKPLLANAAIRPGPAEIALARDMFRDLLRIRASSTLLRLRTADDIRARLRFLNTGAGQNPVVVAAALDGDGYAGAGFRRLVYVINVDKTAQSIAAPTEAGRAYQLHPVHLASTAADKRIAADARFDAGSGRFTVPARSAVVFVMP